MKKRIIAGVLSLTLMLFTLLSLSGCVTIAQAVTARTGGGQR